MERLRPPGSIRRPTIRVHADWLMTPREDLGGQPPHPFLHRGRNWVGRELDNRQRQWSNEGRCPRPLDRDTFAYRHGPLGRHEVVEQDDYRRFSEEIEAEHRESEAAGEDPFASVWRSSYVNEDSLREASSGSLRNLYQPPAAARPAP